MNRLFIFLSVLFALTLSAQRQCGTSQKIAQLSQDREFSQRQREVDAYVKQAISHKMTESNDGNSVITIPVVFHVLYKNGAQNISDSQINSQLAAMNADFRKQNSDFSTVVPAAFQCDAADFEIAFVKASVDPSGEPTSGITRKHVDSDFDLETQYYTEEGEQAWDPSHYLNIWIGRFPTFGYLGFGTPPAAAGQPYDGLVISYKAIGCGGSAIAPYNLGRTVVHELGHYFGLSHPWGIDGSACGDADNDDGIDDTPAINDPHFGVPSYPENSNMCEPDQHGAMFMNFMDYVDDAAMGLFTKDQKTVAQAIINGPRSTFLGVKQVAVDLNISMYPNPADKLLFIKSAKTALEKVEIYTVNGQLKTTSDLGEMENSVSLENLDRGFYIVRIYGEGGKCLKSDKLIKK